MQIVSKVLIPDTSCLILLEKINELELLYYLGERIIITPTIKREMRFELLPWMEMIESDAQYYQEMLDKDLDQGEASALSLCLRIPESVIVIDDLKGRNEAEALNLKYTGTFGLLLKARQLEIIGNIRPFIVKIQQTDFRYDQSIIETVLKASGD